MIPPDSAKIPHDVDSDTPISHWIAVVSYDTEDNCEKALTNIQNSEQDPITLDKTGRLKRLQKSMTPHWEKRAQSTPPASPATISG